MRKWTGLLLCICTLFVAAQAQAQIIQTTTPIYLTTTIVGTTGNTLVVDTTTLIVDAANHRVGVGTAAPGQLLHVKTDAASATNFYLENASVADGALSQIQALNTGNYFFAFRQYGQGFTGTLAGINQAGLAAVVSGVSSTNMLLQANTGTISLAVGSTVRLAATTTGASTTGIHLISTSLGVGANIVTPSSVLEINGALTFHDGSGATYDAVLTRSTSAPYRLMTYLSKGGAAGYQGSHNFDVSYNAGTAFTGMAVAATTDGVTANVGINIAIPTATLHLIGQALFAPAAATGAVVAPFTLNAPANTAVTASTEKFDANFNSARTVQWAQGALTTQRFNLFQAPTVAFATGASTVTDTCTLCVTGAPVSGTNATLSSTHGLLIQAGAVTAATNAFGLTANAPTGGTLNYAAQFKGEVLLGSVIFTSLGTPANGTITFCSDCDPPTLVDSTCTHAGTQTGSFAVRANGAWKCIS